MGVLGNGCAVVVGSSPSVYVSLWFRAAWRCLVGFGFGGGFGCGVSWQKVLPPQGKAAHAEGDCLDCVAD